MSSTYRPICLGHAPALPLATEWTNPGEAMASISNRDSGELAEHRHCDLMIGRYSYPLIEIGCPPSIRDVIVPRSTHHFDHFMPKWLEIHWLRLVAAAEQAIAVEGTGQLRVALNDVEHCWSGGRARKILAMLDGAAPHP